MKESPSSHSVSSFFFLFVPRGSNNLGTHTNLQGKHAHIHNSKGVGIRIHSALAWILGDSGGGTYVMGFVHLLQSNIIFPLSFFCNTTSRIPTHERGGAGRWKAGLFTFLYFTVLWDFYSLVVGESTGWEWGIEWGLIWEAIYLL